MEEQADDDAQSFASAIEEAPSEDEADCADGDIDDLEYLTLDLVNVLPVDCWQRLLEVLRSREGKTLDISRENEELRKEVSALRSAVRLKQASSRGGSLSDVNNAISKTTAATDAPPLDPSELVLRQDLEKRVAALAAVRRGEGKLTDELDEDIREAASETLAFLHDSKNASQHLAKLVAMLTQWLQWATNQELAPRGAIRLLAHVPEETMQLAFRRAIAVKEEHAGRAEPPEFTELPPCVPIALGAVEVLQGDLQAQRVALACIALGAFSCAGRDALLCSNGSGLKAVLGAAAKHPRHPEMQAWSLAAVANAAEDLPRNTNGSSLAWDASALCASALRGFSSAPEVLERAAHALAALLQVHPRRVAAAARAKRLDSIMKEVSERFQGHTGAATLQRWVAEATAAMESHSSFIEGRPDVS